MKIIAHVSFLGVVYAGTLLALQMTSTNGVSPSSGQAKPAVPPAITALVRSYSCTEADTKGVIPGGALVHRVDGTVEHTTFDEGWRVWEARGTSTSTLLRVCVR